MKLTDQNKKEQQLKKTDEGLEDFEVVKWLIIRMTVAAFFGCFLTAYGPAIALFFLTVAKDPVRVIILILRYKKLRSTF